MLENYFKIAWRHLWRNKIFSAITVIGLALGIASALLIIIHVKEELSYDKGFKKADRIFRVTQESLGEDTRHWAALSFPLAFAMQQQFPEVETTVRFYRPYPSQVLSYIPQRGEAIRFEEKGGFFVDPAVVDVFDLPFLRGDAKTALTETNTVVLTEKMAKKYFGDEDPLGKTITDDRSKLPLKVTGVLATFGFNTHLRFDYLLPMKMITNFVDQQSLDRRTWNAFYTYVLLNKNGAAKVTPSLPAFVASYFGKPGQPAAEVIAGRQLHLQPISSIHLHSKLEKEMYPNSDITYIYIFSIVALFILLVAAVNFINISTAQAFSRMKEIGLRKVIGGTRSQLIKQFLGESFLITLVATVIAIILLKWSIPVYNQLAGKEFHFEQVFNLSNVGLLLLLLITIGLLSGFYPAWFVANFNPISSLKGKKNAQSSVHLVRKGLIVFQFAVSVFMIFSTLIIYRQMKFFHSKDLGFDKEQLIAVTMYDEIWKNYSTLTDDIRKNKSISDYSILSTLPGERFSMQTFAPLSATDEDNIPGSRIMWADEKLLPTLGISLTSGRNFFNQFPDIKNQEFILNEAAVKALQLKDPIGKKFTVDSDTGEVVGIIKDFNFASLHTPVEALVIQYNPNRANYLLLKVQPNQLKQALAFLEADIKRLSPASVFNYSFIDEKLDRLYESENRMSMVFKAFAAFAIFIASLGLFGLSVYSVRLRTKEVGIRKLLGASISGVAVLLSRDFLKLIIIATVIAWPLAWWTMTRWLDGFAYHVSIGPGVFILSGIAALVVGMLTVSFQSVRAAIANPVQSLKVE